MTKDRDRSDSPRRQGVSRRDFLKIAAAAGLLAGCSPTQEPETGPTNPPTILPTSAPTAPPAPTDAPEPTASEPSKVVHTHSAVWDGDTLAPDPLRQMLDVSIVELTGLKDAQAAWASLFDPSERIAIKVNTIQSSGYWTHVPLVMAVAESLQDVGIPAEQIVIYDRSTAELKAAGYPVNPDGPGVRCYGTGGNFTPGWTLLDRDISLSDILLECDALINMPILKGHNVSGCTFAMKNHYGSFNRAPYYHRPIGPAIAGLNALPPIRDRTRLIIGDMLTICTNDWRQATTGDSILMSRDPVAHDAIGVQVLSEVLTSQGRSATGMINTAIEWLRNGTELGLGVHDLDNIEWVDSILG